MLRNTKFLNSLEKFKVNYPEDKVVQINDEFLRVSCNSSMRYYFLKKILIFN